MRGELILGWMHDEDRTINYLARASGIDVDRLINAITGSTEPTDDEVAAISDAIDVSRDELRQPAEAMADASGAHPSQCYTVAQAAAILGVSPDLVRAEMKRGVLEYITLGDRAQRVPLWAIEERVRVTGGPPKRSQRAAAEPSCNSADPVGDADPPRRRLL